MVAFKTTKTAPRAKAAAKSKPKTAAMARSKTPDKSKPKTPVTTRIDFSDYWLRVFPIEEICVKGLVFIGL